MIRFLKSSSSHYQLKKRFPDFRNKERCSFLEPVKTISPILSQDNQVSEAILRRSLWEACHQQAKHGFLMCNQSGVRTCLDTHNERFLTTLTMAARMFLVVLFVCYLLNTGRTRGPDRDLLNTCRTRGPDPQPPEHLLYQRTRPRPPEYLSYQRIRPTTS